MVDKIFQVHEPFHTAVFRLLGQWFVLDLQLMKENLKLIPLGSPWLSGTQY